MARHENQSWHVVGCLGCRSSLRTEYRRAPLATPACQGSSTRLPGVLDTICGGLRQVLFQENTSISWFFFQIGATITPRNVDITKHLTLFSVSAWHRVTFVTLRPTVMPRCIAFSLFRGGPGFTNGPWPLDEGQNTKIFGRRVRK